MDSDNTHDYTGYFSVIWLHCHSQGRIYKVLAPCKMLEWATLDQSFEGGRGRGRPYGPGPGGMEDPPAKQCPGKLCKIRPLKMFFASLKGFKSWF